ncbi:MAG: oxaloacetate decarboxylase [Burkholderiales bacterium]
MHWTPRREKFRSYLAGNACVIPASVYDPITLRIAEDLGYEAGMLGGSVASLAVLGAPDLITLTLSEFAGLILRMNRAANLPLVVDADHGYGNALNVRRTVEELETAGVAAMTLEDTMLPAGFGDKGKAKLVSIEEGIGKMRAAVEARQDKDLMIVGRTSAASITSVEDAIARARAYEQVGVDAMFFIGLDTREKLDAVAAAIKLPIFLGTLNPEINDKEYLATRRVRVALTGHPTFPAAVQAAYNILKAQREGTPTGKLAGVASNEMMKKYTRDADYARWMESYLQGR